MVIYYYLLYRKLPMTEKLFTWIELQVVLDPLDV